MRLREKLNGAVFALAGAALLVSCAPEEETCDAIVGTYQPMYIARTGNCGPVAATWLPLDGGATGVKTNTVMEFGRNIVTSVVHKGCSLNVTQEIQAKDGMLESKMSSAGDMAVLSSQQLTGQVFYTRFTRTMPQQIECEGTYEATFVRPDSVSAPTY